MNYEGLQKFETALGTSGRDPRVQGRGYAQMQWLVNPGRPGAARRWAIGAQRAPIAPRGYLDHL